MLKRAREANIVRISVAASGLIPATPTLANTAVSAAKNADSSAQTCHDAIARVSHTAAAEVTRAAVDRRRESYYFRAG